MTRPSAQVGRYIFHTLHRMEGRWTGDAEVHFIPKGVDGSASRPDMRVVTVSLTFDNAVGAWRETQSLTTPDGRVTSQVR